MASSDPYNLARFLAAQAVNYHEAIQELRAGRKLSHWIWYVFPQVAGLGQSDMSQTYAIGSRQEAVGYLEHPVLGPRLLECVAALLTHTGKPIRQIMGSPDDQKLNSSMTLFAAISPDGSPFHQVLSAYYPKGVDARTLSYLKDHPQ